MANITLQGHFDGNHILLDEQFELKPNDKLLITVLSENIESSEREFWRLFAHRNLNRAYSDDEPEYTMSMVKEPNPKYEGR